MRAKNNSKEQVAGSKNLKDYKIQNKLIRGLMHKLYKQFNILSF